MMGSGSLAWRVAASHELVVHPRCDRAPGDPRPARRREGQSLNPAWADTMDDVGGGIVSAAGRSPGFTLIEVLLALALFAISVVVLASAYVNVLFGLEAVRVDRVLEQEMAFVRSVVLTAPDRDTIEEGGEVPTAELGYAYWKAELEPTDVADLFIVNVSITLEGAGRVEERTMNDRLVVLRPSWSDPIEREELRSASKERLAELNLNRPL